MKKIRLLACLLCFLPSLVNAQVYKGQVGFLKVPAPAQHYQQEYTFDTSGMENLDEPFKKAIQYSTDDNKENWKFHYGTWLAGRGNSEEAIKILSQTKVDVAKALLARLLKLKGDMNGAKKAFEIIEEKWLQLHPQIIIERDKVLRNLGTQTIPEREKWLSKVDALKDEWIIERRVQLLTDKGEVQKAKDLLLSTSFQKVHQTYTRTGLWMQICEKLKIPCLPIPEQLGEDRLATFGGV